MNDLSVIQDNFLDYLLNANGAIVAETTVVEGSEREERLSIYYNAYRVRFCRVIETDHPTLGVYLGDEQFKAMTAAYIATYRSTHTSLRHFCDQLPDFLRSTWPFTEHTILADIAQFERLLMDVYDAADANPIDLRDLTNIPPDTWPGLRLSLHPSVRLFVTRWNTIDIWRAIRSDSTPPEVTQGENYAWLLWRNHERLTEFRSVAVDEHVLLSCVLAGDSFSDVCDALLEWYDSSEASVRATILLEDWVRIGIVVGATSEPRND